MLCDMSHITCGNFFRFEVAKLPPQTRRLPAQGLADANPAYICGVGLAWARLGLVNVGPGRNGWPSPAAAGQGPREPAGSPLVPEATSRGQPQGCFVGLLCVNI
jgi:hypothetical protein